MKNKNFFKNIIIVLLILILIGLIGATIIIIYVKQNNDNRKEEKTTETLTSLKSNNNENVILTTNNSKALEISNSNGMSSVILGMNIIGDLVTEKPKLYSSSSYYDIYLPGEDTYMISSPSDINYDVMIMFQNSLMYVEGSSISSAIFNPKGIISIEGENTDFKLSLTFGEGYYNILWHTIEVSGENVNMAKLERIGDDMLITCDNMQNIMVIGENNDEKIVLTFSTYKEQVLLKMEGNTIVAYIKNGIFNIPTAKSQISNLDL